MKLKVSTYTIGDFGKTVKQTCFYTIGYQGRYPNKYQILDNCIHVLPDPQQKEAIDNSVRK